MTDTIEYIKGAEAEANDMSDLLNQLAEECDAAMIRHRASGFHEWPATCGGCHWWRGFAGALTEIRYRREHPGQREHTALHPIVSPIRGKSP